MIAFRSSVRSLLRGKMRTLLALLSLVIGTASFFSMFLLSELATRSITDSSRSLLGGDLLITSYLEPMQKSKIQQNLSTIKFQGEAAYSYTGQGIVQSDRRTTSVIIKGIDPQIYPYYGEAYYPNIRSMQKDELLLSESTADRLQVRVGDMIRFPSTSDGEMHVYRVKGIVRNIQENYGDANIFGAAYLYADQTRSLLNVPSDSVNEILIRAKSADIAALKASLKKSMPQAALIDSQDQAQERLLQAKIILVLLKVFSLLALMIGSLAVFNTMKQSLYAKIKDIAVMKAIGMRLRTITLALLAEGLLIGIVGTAVGLSLGIFISFGLTDYLSSVLSLPLDWSFSWRASLYTLSAGLISALLSSWLPLKNKLNVSPMRLLREDGLDFSETPTRLRNKIGLLGLIAGFASIDLSGTLFLGTAQSAAARFLLTFTILFVVFLFIAAFGRFSTFVFSLIFKATGRARHILPPKWYLPFHNLKAERKRYGFLSLVLAVGVTSAVSSELFATNLIGAVSSELQQESGGTLLVTTSLAQQEQTRKTLKDIGVKGWTESVQMNATFEQVNGNAVQEPFKQQADQNKFFSSNKLSVEGVDVKHSLRTYELASGRDLSENDDSQPTVLLLEDYQKIGVKIGDSVSIGFGKKKASFQIIGFFRSGIVKTVGMRTSQSTLMLYGKPSRLVFSVDGGSETASLLKKLNTSLPSASMAYSIADTASDSLSGMIRTISTFFSIVTLFSFLTAILTIGNQIAINLLRKRREMAIVKTIGISDFITLQFILLENLILALIAGIFGTLTALLFTSGAMLLLFKAPVRIHAEWVAYGIALCVVTTILVAWIAAVPSLRIKPKQLLVSHEL